MLVLLKASLGTRSKLLAAHAGGKMQMLNQFVSFLLLCRNGHQIFGVYIVDNISEGSKISPEVWGWGEGVASTPKFGAKTYHLTRFLTKTAWERKKFDRWGGVGGGGGVSIVPSWIHQWTSNNKWSWDMSLKCLQYCNTIAMVKMPNLNTKPD